MNSNGLIVGLGNPGKEYDNTRHNLGFMAADYIMEDALRFDPTACTAVSSGKKKYQLWKCFPAGLRAQWFVTKPLTYMNLSGEAVGHICNYYNISADNVIVMHDELDLPLGRMKFKTGGGHAGHNGLKSIAQHLGTKDFHRLRLGIGKPEHGNTSNYVLGKFTKTEMVTVNEVLVGALKGIATFIQQGAAATVQEVNSFQTTA